MTRSRVYGEETPFSSWLRKQPDLDSVRDAMYATDVDMIIHKYKTGIDNVGTRGVQCLMWVEVKTRGALPTENQLQPMYFWHQAALNTCSECGSGSRKYRAKYLDYKSNSKVMVRNFGVFVLSLAGTTPADGEIRWVSFTDDANIRTRIITEAQLVDVLGFRLRPDTLKTHELRRHHTGRTYVMEERCGQMRIIGRSS